MILSKVFRRSCMIFKRRTKCASYCRRLPVRSHGLFFAPVLLFLCSTLLLAQESSTFPRPQMSFGVIGGYSLLSNRTTLSVYEATPSCGSFSNGESQAPFFGLTYDYPLIDGIDVSARLLFAQRPARLSMRTDNGLRAYDEASGTDVPFIRENVFDANLKYLCVDAGLKIRPFELLDIAIPIYIRAAIDAGDPIFGNSFTQTEEIIQPRTRTFPDGTLRHTLASGSLTNTGTTYGVNGSAGYELRLDRHTILSVEAGYRRGLNSVVKNQDWRVVSYFGAINLSYAIVEEEQKPLDPPVPPPVKAEPPPVVVQAPAPLVIEAFKTTPLEVQETVVTETYPLLPYIFFDSSSAQLRDRYTAPIDRATFKEKNLVKSTLAIYYHMLDVIASRMQSMPASSITLVGTTDGRERSSAATRKTLADERAASVREYLTSVWGIDRDRIHLNSRDIPQLASNPVYAEGLEENRRVEIIADDPAILAPVVHARFQEYAPIQSNQVFSVKALRPELAKSWEARIYKNKNEAHVSGEKLPPSISFSVDSAVMVAIGREITNKDSLDASLSVLQSDGSSVNAQCRFPIIKSQNQFEVSRLSLIVFDFDQSAISETNKTMMQTFIREAMHPDSRVTIRGSTDRLGEAAYNVELSQSRANAAQNFLRQLQDNIAIDKCEGVGASVLPYDNNVPEGRYYCRTVSIVVQTPVQKKQ